SMDLRKRVARAWDTSGDAEDIAATFGVSRAWVHRLIQRRRETACLAPRQQTKFRSRVLAGRAAASHADHGLVRENRFVPDQFDHRRRPDPTKDVQTFLRSSASS